MGKSRKLRFYCVLYNEKLSGQLDGRQTCQTAREPLLRQTPYRRQTLSYVLAFTPLLCDVLRRTRRRRGERSASGLLKHNVFYVRMVAFLHMYVRTTRLCDVLGRVEGEASVPRVVRTYVCTVRTSVPSCLRLCAKFGSYFPFHFEI